MSQMNMMMMMMMMREVVSPAPSSSSSVEICSHWKELCVRMELNRTYMEPPDLGSRQKQREYEVNLWRLTTPNP